MKRSFLFALAIVLTACSTTPFQVTVTPEMTFTLPPPTNTPEPTSTPQSTLPSEVMEKFEKAGINPSDLENATFDENGIHITIDGKTIDISVDEFKANTFNAINSNDIRIIDTQNNDGVFVINKTEDDKLVVEKQTFIPANDIEFSENLSKYDLKLAPDANKKAIYEDIAISHLGDATSRSEGMEFNRRVYEEIIKVHPEWEGIGNGDDYKVRGEFMKEFLKRTGGLMVVANHNYEKFEANFNLPVGFEVEEVDTLSANVMSPIGLGLPGNLMGRGAGGIVKEGNNKQLMHKLEIVPEGMDEALNNGSYFYAAFDWNAGGVVSRLFNIIIAKTAFKNIDSDALNYKLYTRGGIPGSSTYYRDVNWTFIR